MAIPTVVGILSFLLFLLLLLLQLLMLLLLSELEVGLSFRPRILVCLFCHLGQAFILCINNIFIWCQMLHRIVSHNACIVYECGTIRTNHHRVYLRVLCQMNLVN